MKKLLNTVYVTSENASLRKDGENLVASIDGAERSRVPLHMLESVVTFGAIYDLACADRRLRAGRYYHSATRSQWPLPGSR